MSELQNFIEQNGHIYKLHESKEEAERRRKAKEDQQAKNIGNIREALGKELFDQLVNDGVVVEWGYNPTYKVSFGAKTVDLEYEYGDGRQESLGEYVAKETEYKYTAFFTELVLKLLKDKA